MECNKNVSNKNVSSPEAPLITENKSNLEIFSENLDLLKECIEFQFRKLCKLDPGKRQFKDDLFQDVCIWILTYNNEKLNDAYRKKHINALFTRIIQNQIYSNSSKFYRQYLDFDKRALWDTTEYVDRKENGEKKERKQEED